MKTYYTAPLIDTSGKTMVVRDIHSEEDVSYKKVVAQINEHFNIPGFRLYTKMRSKRNISFARQIAMYVLYNFYGYTLMEVGEIFDRDHTTVVSANRLINGFLSLKHCEDKDVILSFLTKYNYA